METYIDAYQITREKKKYSEFEMSDEIKKKIEEFQQ